MKKTFLLFGFLWSCCLVFAQQLPEKGVPELTDFSPSAYGNQGKIWDITSSQQGILFFAAEKGLMQYDGFSWKTYKGSKGFTRSVFVANDSLILTGSDMDFGIWKRNSVMAFSYESLYPYKNKAGNQNEEFWNVAVVKGKPTFVSHHNLYVQKQGKINRIAAPTRFTESFLSQGVLYLSDEKKGLYQFNGEQLQRIAQFLDNKNLEVIGRFVHGNQVKWVTKNNGLWQQKGDKLEAINGAISQQLMQDKVFSFATINKNYLAFGTILNGIYITDLEGKVIHHIDKQKGLLNNTILSLYYDVSGNLWAGMDYGLAQINLKNRTNYFIDYKGDFGTGYDAALLNDTFYLGTNQGLYASSWKNLGNENFQETFRIVNGSEGQVWDLQIVEGEILVGHDLGLFKLNANALQKINNELGVWTIKPFGKDYLLTGNYNGVSVFKKENGAWKFVKKINSIVGSCNQIEFLGNTLWINIPNYGIIKAVLDPQFNLISRQIFKAENFKGDDVQISTKDNQLLVSTDLYDYQFSKDQDRFIQQEKQSSTGFLTNALAGYSTPKALNDSYSFYPVYNGFALKNISNSTNDFSVYPLSFRGIEIFNNDEKKQWVISRKIPYLFNNIRLQFIVPQESHVLYQYRLGENATWSNWTKEGVFEFLDLKEGRYDFYVRAKVDGALTKTMEVSFTVRPPWYRSLLAYFGYFLLFVMVVFGVRKRQKGLLEKQKLALLKKQRESLRLQQEKHEQEKLLLEQKRLEREKEILQQKVKDKTIELAQKAKEDEDKNRLLQEVTEKVVEIEDNPNLSKMRLKEIRRMLKNYLETEDHTFEIQMDELHQAFFKALKKEHPSLSIYDLRLCAYLKIGLTSKEMADILQILPSSINVSRSRLRKKLGLNPDDDLFAFLNKF